MGCDDTVAIGDRSYYVLLRLLENNGEGRSIITASPKISLQKGLGALDTASCEFILMGLY